MENVSIRVDNAILKTDQIRLNEIFPQVWHLDLIFKQIPDPDFVDSKFHILEQLGIITKSTEIAFENILRENPQINYVAILSSTPSGKCNHMKKKQKKSPSERRWTNLP